mmetsp:Transcript_21683/g.74501  ORF Transcript_21683/g.74501 Transcript_21683/m.74501 type:complete len:483 (-) Transcript_21683:1022-2470(-)
MSSRHATIDSEAAVAVLLQPYVADLLVARRDMLHVIPHGAVEHLAAVVKDAARDHQSSGQPAADLGAGREKVLGGGEHAVGLLRHHLVQLSEAQQGRQGAGMLPGQCPGLLDAHQAAVAAAIKELGDPLRRRPRHDPLDLRADGFDDQRRHVVTERADAINGPTRAPEGLDVRHLVLAHDQVLRQASSHGGQHLGLLAPRPGRDDRREGAVGHVDLPLQHTLQGLHTSSRRHPFNIKALSFPHPERRRRGHRDVVHAEGLPRARGNANLQPRCRGRGRQGDDGCPERRRRGHRDVVHAEGLPRARGNANLQPRCRGRGRQGDDGCLRFLVHVVEDLLAEGLRRARVAAQPRLARDFTDHGLDVHGCDHSTRHRVLGRLPSCLCGLRHRRRRDSVQPDASRRIDASAAYECVQSCAIGRDGWPHFVGRPCGQAGRDGDATTILQQLKLLMIDEQDRCSGHAEQLVLEVIVPRRGVEPRDVAKG